MKKSIFAVMLSISLVFSYGCSTKKTTDINSTNGNTKNIAAPTAEDTKVSQKYNEDTSQGTTESTDKTTDKTAANTKKAAAKYTIKDIYPFKANTKYEYTGKGNEYASYTVFTDYIKNNRIQLRTNNGGTEVVSVLENKNGQLKIIYSKEETYYREDLTSKKSNKNEILLKEPLVKGTSWTLPDGRKRYISNIDVSVSTPAGKFKAVEVTTEGNGFKDLDYYASGKGLVKTVYKAKDMEVTSSLSKIKTNSPLAQTVRFYYPNINDDKIYYIDKNLTFKTNDITRLTFEKMFKSSPNKEVGKLLSTNAKIKSLYLNGSVVYADFSKEFVSEMNAGSGYEAMILQSIVNTLGRYYGVSKVYMTVENKPYASGHIEMQKGEAFKVDTKNTVKIK